MIAWYVILVLVGYLVVGLVANIVIYYYLEKNEEIKYLQGITIKAVTIFVMELNWLYFALIPTDCYNFNNKGELNIDVLWFFTSVFSLLILIIAVPFTIAYYEAETDVRITKTHPWLQAFKRMSIVAGITLSVFVIFYFAFRNLSKTKSTNDGLFANLEKIPFHLFPFIFNSFFAWFLLTIYLGIGLFSLPITLMLQFKNRPIPISVKEYGVARDNICESIIELKVQAEEFRKHDLEIRQIKKKIQRWKERRVYNQKFKKFQAKVENVENKFNQLIISLKKRGENPIWSYTKLFAGILFCIWSICIIFQMVVAILLPQIIRNLKFGFLDDFMIIISKADFYFLDLLFCFSFIVYIQASLLVGYFYLNRKILKFLRVYPLKIKDTPGINILINNSLILIVMPAVIHLFYLCFKKYCSGAYSSYIYEDIVLRVSIYSALSRHNIFIWLLFTLMLLYIGFYIIRPSVKNKSSMRHILTQMQPHISENISSTNKKASTHKNISITMEKTADKIANSANIMGKMAGL